MGRAGRLREDGESMGVSYARDEMEGLGGVREKRGEAARQGDMLESRFDCLKETNSELGERSMAGEEETKEGGDRRMR